MASLASVSTATLAENVVEAMEDAAIVVDMAGEIIYVNNRVKQVVPDSVDILGTSSISALDPYVGDDTLNQYANALNEAIEEGGKAQLNVPIELPSDRMVLDLRFSPLRLDEEQIGAVIIARDITKRARIQDQLMYLNALLRHDIRNDLIVAQGWAELLNESDSPDQDAIDRISRACEHGIQLTKTARDLVKVLASGGSEFDRYTVSVDETLTSEIERVRNIYPEATVVVDESLPEVQVEANELLGSVLGNILTNGIKHNDRSEPRIEVEVTELDEAVEILISDNGPGIPEKQRDALFQQGTPGESSAGTGMGLYLVEQVVTAYGGEVWVTDNSPRGAVFGLKLPKAESSRSRLDDGPTSE